MVKVLVRNKEELMRGNMVSRWIDLPDTTENLLEQLAKISINSVSDTGQYYISECKSDMPAFDKHVIPHSNLELLNIMAANLHYMEPSEREKVNTVLDLYEPHEQINLFQTVTEYQKQCQHNHIKNPTQLGIYALSKLGINANNLPDDLSGFVNLEGIGHKVASMNGGIFTDQGYFQREPEIKLQAEQAPTYSQGCNQFYIELYVENRVTEEHTELVLPMPEAELTGHLAGISIPNYANNQDNVAVDIIDYNADQITLDLNGRMDLYQMNRLAQLVDKLDMLDIDVFEEIFNISWTDNPSIDFMVEIAENAGKFQLLRDIQDIPDLGDYYIFNEEYSPLGNNLPEDIAEAGEMILREQDGAFVGEGYLYCTDRNFKPAHGIIPSITNPEHPIMIVKVNYGAIYTFPTALDQYELENQNKPEYQINTIRDNILDIELDKEQLNCNISELNGLCEKISRFSMSEFFKYKAVASIAHKPSYALLDELADNIGRFELWPDVHRHEDIGNTCTHDGYIKDFPYEGETEADARNHAEELAGKFLDEYGGTFTDYGFVFCKDPAYSPEHGRFKTESEIQRPPGFHLS